MERRIIFQKRNKQTNKQKEQQQKYQSLSYWMIEAEIPQGIILYLLLK